jgi:hypothetical protein
MDRMRWSSPEVEQLFAVSAVEQPEDDPDDGGNENDPDGDDDDDNGSGDGSNGDNQDSGSDSLSVGAIVGIAVGAVAALALLIAGAWYWRRRRMYRPVGGADEHSPPSPLPMKPVVYGGPPQEMPVVAPGPAELPSTGVSQGNHPWQRG